MSEAPVPSLLLAEWAACPTRGPLVRLWLREGVKRNRTMATRAAKAYAHPFLGLPAGLLATLHDQCADLFQHQLDRLEASAPPCPPPAAPSSGRYVAEPRELDIDELEYALQDDPR